MKTPLPQFSTIRNCTIHHTAKVIGWANLYDSTIGEECVIGPFVEIGGAIIGDRTVVSSHSYIPPWVEVGTDCFIAHGVMFTNDTFDSPKHFRKIEEMRKQWKPRPTTVGNRVRIGSGAVILPVQIGHNCIVGAGAVVTHDMPEGSIWAGNPAREMSRH